MEALDVFKSEALRIAALPPEEYHAFVDQFESKMSEAGLTLSCKLDIDFQDGVMRRTIYMPAGALISSKIHITNHNWVIHSGAVYVIEQGAQELRLGGSFGVTKAGTRRLLWVAANCIWSTYHYVGDETDLVKIEEKLILPREPLPCLAN